MKLINQSAEIIPQGLGLEGIYKQIEIAGRTCYKSHDKMTTTSAKDFVDRMIKSGHGAMLEHGTVYLRYTSNDIIQKDSFIQTHWKYEYNKYSKCVVETLQGTGCFGRPYDAVFYVTTNLRVLVENDWLDDLEYLCEPTEHHEKRVTLKLTTDQGILREFTRHRVFSFAVESTRYCNYSKDKHNNEITYILPTWLNGIELPKSPRFHCSDDWGTVMYEHYYDFTEEGKKDWDTSKADINNFLYALESCEQMYLSLIKLGWKPQQARNILPLATKCEMIMTGFESDWKHFLSLRCDKAAHPQAVELATQIKTLLCLN